MRFNMIVAFSVAMVTCQSFGAEPAAPTSVTEPEHRIRSTESNEKILAALRTSMETAYEGIPLNKLLSSLADRTNAPIWIDQAELERHKIDPSIPVSLHLPAPISLRSALRVVLSPHGLDFTMRHDVLCITSKSAVQLHAYSLMYDIQTRYDPASVAELIQKIIGANHDKKTSKAVVQLLTSKDKKSKFASVFVRANRYAHSEIEEALKIVRRK